MKTYTIPQKMSGTGSIHDIASDQFPREIRFRSGCRYAVVLASYYGGNTYTTHMTKNSAVRRTHRLGDYAMSIIDSDGHYYDVIHHYDGPTLERS